MAVSLVMLTTTCFKNEDTEQLNIVSNLLIVDNLLKKGIFEDIKNIV